MDLCRGNIYQGNIFPGNNFTPQKGTEGWNGLSWFLTWIIQPHQSKHPIDPTKNDTNMTVRNENNKLLLSWAKLKLSLVRVVDEVEVILDLV